MNLFKKIVHYADPRTHLKAVRSAAHHVGASAHRVGAFHQRLIGGANLKRVGRGIAQLEAKIVPYLTAALAFVGSVVFTPLVGAALTAAGGGIARVQGATAARAKGKHGADARREGRHLRDKTFEYGAYGTTAGVLTSVGVAALTAESAVAAGGSVTAASSGDAALLAGEAGAVNTAAVGQDAANVALDSILAQEAAANAPGLFDTAAEAAAAAKGFSPLPAGGVAALQAAQNAAAGGGGFLSGLWSGVKDVVDLSLKVGPALQQFLKAKGAAGGADARGAGGGQGGAEGTGGVGTDGGLLDEIAGLPLAVKLGAGAVGAGLLYVAFRKKGRAA